MGLEETSSVANDLGETQTLETCTKLLFGSYAVHKDPKSEAGQSVSMFEDEMTRDRSPRAYK